MRVHHAARCAAVLSLALLPSCAWSNRDNRPVWNEFERHLVPESDGLFLATLPVTVPLGLASIVVDAVIAHPIQVIGDAVVDASRPWQPAEFDFEDSYYTEAAFLPFRVVGTPLVFAGSFCGRVLWDIAPAPLPLTTQEREQAAAQAKQEQAVRARAEFLTWLQTPGVQRSRYAGSLMAWHPSFAEPMRQALRDDAAGRLTLHTGMLAAGRTSFGVYDAEAGLRDPDPVVRYECIAAWPRNVAEPSAALLDALRSDAVEAVRLLARRTFPR